jgi:predicted SAM-dependent methyltransferase
MSARRTLSSLAARARRSHRLRELTAEARSQLLAARLKLSPEQAHKLAACPRVHVGCGPKNLFPDWINVDLRPFPGVDLALDVTRAWPFAGLTHVYSEHFLEHLDLEAALEFLARAGRSLVEGGRLRLSTPNLDWVVATHYSRGPVSDEARRGETFRTNRAFHGWGHRFLYTRELLAWVLEELGYEALAFFAYGESDDPLLRGLERHGGWEVFEGRPSVVIVEAVRGARAPAIPAGLRREAEQAFLRYVRSGH